MSTQELAKRFVRGASLLSHTALAVVVAVLLPTAASATTPSVVITAPTDGEVVTRYAEWTDPSVAVDPVVVTFVVEGSPVTCSLDDQAPVPCSSPVSFDHVVAGEHRVTVAAGSASQMSTFTVQTFALAPPPELVITDGPNFAPASVNARWKVGSRATWVRLLGLRGMPRHVRVHVACHGSGCPAAFSRRASGTLDLTHHFRGHVLRPGTRILIRVSKSGEQIATFRYAIRSGVHPRLVRT